MARIILGAIAGLVVTMLLVVVGQVIGAVALGDDTVYQPDSYAPSGLWVGLQLGVGLLSAIIGGFLCAVIARPGRKAPLMMVAAIIVLGVIPAVLTATASRPDPEPRPASPSITHRVENAPLAKPVWIFFAEPVVGIFGVLIGAGLRGGKQADDGITRPPE